MTTQITHPSQRIFIVHGMKRCGNHAIINWIMGQDAFVHMNNLFVMEKILSGERSIPSPRPFWLQVHRKMFPSFVRPFWRLTRFFWHKKNFIVNLEDHSLSVKPFRDPPATPINIVLLRDPANLFASRIRKAARKPKGSAYDLDRLPQSMERWKEHAREFLDETQLLDHKVCIYFNRWFQDQAYRQSISEQLQLTFSDQGYEKVSDHGGGSSFDQSSFDGNTQEMKILNRADMLEGAEKKALETVLSNPEIARLWASLKEIHGE